LPVEKPYAKNVYWMYHVVLKGDLSDKRTEIMRKLAEKGIETREGFIPYNLQEIFLKEGLTKKEDCPKAKKIAYSSFYIPSGPLLTKEEREYVAKILKEIIL
jgi:perosamine synthetase